MQTNSYARTPDKTAEKPRTSQPDEPRNYENPDGLNVSIKGRIATIQLINNRIESGKITRLGQYFIEMTLPNGRPLIINKAAIVTVTVM